MKLALTAKEVRVLGALLEKAVVTPDQYPLTLNALTNACNQKTSRDPVMHLDPGVVQHTARGLESRHLVVREENFKSRVEKYKQRLCNTPFAEFQFSPAEYAVICLLLLRGPQTPGELRTRSGRLHEFADNEAVREVLEGLAAREDGPLVEQLARRAGRQDAEWEHLLGAERAPVPDEAPPQTSARGTAPAAAGPGADSALEARVAALEAAVTELQRRLTAGDVPRDPSRDAPGG